MIHEDGQHDSQEAKSLQRRFDEFHQANPQVYAFLVERCREVYRPGRKIGMTLLISQLRWQSLVKTDSKDGYKINQNFASRYARLIIADHPEWDGLFEFRALHTAYTPPESREGND